MLPFIQYQTTSLHSPLNSSQYKDFLHFLQYKDLIKIPCNVVTVYRNQNCETELKYLEPHKINSTAPGPFIPGQYGLTQFISDWGLNLSSQQVGRLLSPSPPPSSLYLMHTNTSRQKKYVFQLATVFRTVIMLGWLPGILNISDDKLSSDQMHCFLSLMKRSEEVTGLRQTYSW